MDSFPFWTKNTINANQALVWSKMYLLLSVIPGRVRIKHNNNFAFGVVKLGLPEPFWTEIFALNSLDGFWCFLKLDSLRDAIWLNRLVNWRLCSIWEFTLCHHDSLIWSSRPKSQTLQVNIIIEEVKFFLAWELKVDVLWAKRKSKSCRFLQYYCLDRARIESVHYILFELLLVPANDLCYFVASCIGLSFDGNHMLF